MYIYYKDHGFPHVEIYQGSPGNYEAKLKIMIGTWEVLEQVGFKNHVANKVIKYLIPLEKELMEAWNEITEK